MTWRQRHFKPSNKYKNNRTEYKGIYYDSKKEAQYAAELDLRKKAGEVIEWERQVTIPLDVNGKHVATYRIDFIAECADGIREYIEVKGFRTQYWMLKFKLFEALYGDQEDIRIVVV